MRWRRNPGRWGAAATVLVGIAVIPTPARADFDFQFAANLNGGWLRSTPPLATKGASTSARELAKGDLATRGGLGMIGASADIELTIDDRWKVPLIGGAGYWAVGSYDEVVTSYDGSIAKVRPWSAFRGDILLPGFGRRWKQRRNMWGLGVRTGLSFMTMEGSVAAGAESYPLDLNAFTVLVQVELEGCRRLDPTMRVCAQVVPRVYEHGIMNGLTFGVRFEWGR